MGDRINKLVQSVLQKDTLEDCSLNELQLLAERHPYFGAAQLLLAKKLQTLDDDLYKKQVEKTALCFHNPLWLDHLLNDTGTVSEITNGVSAPVLTEEPVPVIKKEVPPVPAAVKQDFLFEPLHTTDYFASQGIKIREEELANDKFGKQLKSFTEWLKTMKRVPGAELEKQIPPVAVKKVEQLAEHSIQDRQVVTEAMADVWIKQGNREKAIDIYSKLSLLDPSKSAYFAAKIAELK